MLVPSLLVAVVVASRRVEAGLPQTEAEGDIVIYIGQVLPGMGMSYGFRNCYEELRIEAFGADWVIARDRQGLAWHADSTPDEITSYLEREAGSVAQ